MSMSKLASGWGRVVAVTLATVLGSTALVAIAAPPAFAGDAPISALVVLGPDGVAVEGAQVTIVATTGDTQHTFETDDSGVVTFGAPVTTDESELLWIIAITPPEGSALKPTYWGGPTSDDAVAVAIGGDDPASEVHLEAAQLPEEPQRATISGHVVTDSLPHLPLEGVYVAFSRDSSSYGYAFTDADGEYTIDQIDAGDYVASFTFYGDVGSAPYGYATTYGGNVVLEADATTTVVGDGDAITLDAQMVENGLISGSISTVSNGVSAPSTDKTAGLFTAGGTQLVSSYGVQDDGTFTFVAPPGSYKTGFGNLASSFSFDVTQAFDRVSTLDDAEIITVQSGQQNSGIDAIYGASASVPVVTPGSVSIAGDAIAGSTLAAQTSGWTPSGATFSYQWLRYGNPIAGATASTYRLTLDDVQSRISVRVSGAVSGYTPANATSLRTDAVVDPNPPGRLVVSVKNSDGDSIEGAALSVTNVTSNVWAAGTSDWDGLFFASLPAGSYRITVTPSDSDQSPVSVITTIGSDEDIAVEVTLVSAVKPPAGTTLQPSRSAAGEVPSVFSGQALAFTTSAPAGATHASYGIVFVSGADTVTGTLTEGEAGSYSAVIPPLASSGAATITATFEYATGAPFVVTFDIYIDPSGTVVDQFGTPVEGATVTLSRSDTETGSYDVVPDGSVIMSAGNRVNPGISAADGRFGWDVIAGWYKVTAEKNGVSYVTAALPVPPEQLDLVLPLAFVGLAAPVAVTAPSIAGKPVAGGVLTVTAAMFATVANASDIEQSFQWTRNGQPIAGATAATYTLVAADAGTTISMIVTASRPGFQQWALATNSLAIGAATSALAATGADISGALTAAALLLAIGSGAFVVSRRRRVVGVRG